VTSGEALVLGLILGATRDGLEVLGYTRTIGEAGELQIGAGPVRVVVTVRERAAEGDA